MAGTNNRWEELRRKARQLEGEIDMKLVSFSKLGTNPAGEGGDHTFEAMAREIEQLVEQLSRVNDSMTEHTQIGAGSSPAVLHTLQRHREILNDYTQEFRKTKANITAAKEREQLLTSIQREINDYKNPQNSTDSYYSREQSRLLSSHQMTNDAISIALATKEDLVAQRQQFRGIEGRIRGLAARIPGLNTLMRHIDLRKRRDSLILASVVSACIFFCLWYLFG
eukprot:comp11387_c0_seq1/m.5754 comp11387_c0_seq1/g.5754  ORF comp11387_c0_seq1/g.5754 comp11387_c0_seq1/m.5754 type:complete len:224 (-) comp11387_c0_seq1:151-822(-)